MSKYLSNHSAGSEMMIAFKEKKHSDFLKIEAN